MLTKKIFLQALPTLEELESTADTCDLFTFASDSCEGCPFHDNDNRSCYNLTNETYVTFLTNHFPELLV